ncbi:MAG: LamG-like jellyroll fold domain-containing protein [Panacagrimonas sp.]
MNRNRLRHLTAWMLVATLSLANVSAQTPKQVPLEFDGNASLSYPKDPIFEIGPDGTIDFWLKAGWTEALEQDACIVASGDKNRSRYAAYISGDGQGVVLWDGQASAGVDFNFLDGEAHHVALVTRGRETRFFVDGALLGTKPIGYGTARGLPFHVGTSDGGAEGFIGALQSLRLWSAALSDAQIVEIGALAGEPPAGSALAPLLRVVSDFTDTAQELVLLDPPAVAAAAPATLPLAAASPATPALTATTPPPPPVDPGIHLWSIKTAADRWRQPAGTPQAFAGFRQGAIDFWVQFDSAWVAEEGHGTLVAYSNGYETVFEVGVTASGDGIVMANGRRDDYNQPSEQSNIVSADLNDGRIHHVALITEGDATEVFVDGRSRGVASVGYALAEDAAGPKTNLQLSIGSLDGRRRAFQGRIGGVRVWGAPLPGPALFRAAFLRDNELGSVPWATAFLIAQLENLAGRSTQPALRFLPPLHLPAGVWMVPAEAQRRQAKPGGSLQDIDWSFVPQRYVQLVVAAPDSELARFAGGGGSAPAVRVSAAAPAAAPAPTVVTAPSGFRMLASAGVGGQPTQLLNGIDLESCAQQCRSASAFVCASFDYVPAVKRCELNAGTEPLRQGVSGSYSFLPTGAAQPAGAGAVPAAALSSLTPARPGDSAAGAEVPVLVWLEFRPFKSATQPETLSAKLFRPVGRNEYRAGDGSALQLSSPVYLTAAGETLQRFDIPDRPPRAGQPRIDDVFIVGNQVRNRRSGLHGWDPIQLNPFDFSRPEGGRKADLFDYSPYGYTENARMVVPKGFELIDLQSGEGRREHKEVMTELKLQEELGAMVSVGGGIEAVKAAGSFSANASFNTRSEKLNSGTYAFTLGQTVNQRVALVLDKANIRLTEPFRQAVMNATRGGPSVASARALVQQFGTHYANALVLGGRIVEIVEMDSETWGVVASTGFGVGAAVEARIGLQQANASFNFAASMDKAKEESFRSTVQNSKENWYYSGGQAGGSAGSWQVSDETMAPIYLDLRPISELLAPPFFLDPAVFDRLRPLVRDAMREHVQQTAGRIELDQKFVPKSVARYVPPTPKKDCAANPRQYRGWLNSDDGNDNGGGVWVQFGLPAKQHGDSQTWEAGCWARDHYELGFVVECNRVCWSSAVFLCNDGTWEKKSGEFTDDRLCHSTGNTEQEATGMLKGRGNPSWATDLCEVLPPGVPGRPAHCPP